MLITSESGALAAVDPGLVRLHPCRTLPVWPESRPFPGELGGIQKEWITASAFFRESNEPAGPPECRIRLAAGEYLLRIWTVITKAPPPLGSRNLYGHRPCAGRFGHGGAHQQSPHHAADEVTMVVPVQMYIQPIPPASSRAVNSGGAPAGDRTALAEDAAETVAPR